MAAATAATDDRLARVLELLRAKGARVTAARRALVTALLEAPGHATADDLAVAVRRTSPEVHLSTVYRTLDALERLGVVDHAHLGHGHAVYHLAERAHQHLVCEACGAVVEAPDALFADLAARLRADYGFASRLGHFALGGRCASCA